MSVILIDKETFERVGKFFLAWKGESGERILRRLSEWEKYNRKNFELRYSENLENPPTNFKLEDLSSHPLISPEQMYKSLDFIKYQCIDYANEIDEEDTLNLINDYMDEVKAIFNINPLFLEHCLWG